MFSLGRFIVTVLIPRMLIASALFSPLAHNFGDVLETVSAQTALAAANAQPAELAESISDLADKADAEKEQAKQTAKAEKQAEAPRAQAAAQTAQTAQDAPAEPAAQAETIIEQISAEPQDQHVSHSYTETFTWVEEAPAAAPEAAKPGADGIFHFGAVQHKIGDSFAHDNDQANEWQENYFVAHSGSPQGRIISALSKGAKIEVEDVVVTICGNHYGAAGEDYGALRDKVGWDKVCFQTCIDMAGNYIVWYGTTSGGAQSAAAQPAPAQPAAEESVVEFVETTTYETTVYETVTYDYAINDLSYDVDIDDFDFDYDDYDD